MFSLEEENTLQYAEPAEQKELEPTAQIDQETLEQLAELEQTLLLEELLPGEAVIFEDQQIPEEQSPVNKRRRT